MLLVSTLINKRNDELKIKEKPEFDQFLNFFSTDFCRWFKYIAKNIENFSFNFFSYLACNQIWLNHLTDHYHSGYNTKKLPKKTTDHHCCGHNQFLLAPHQSLAASALLLCGPLQLLLAA